MQRQIGPKVGSEPTPGRRRADPGSALLAHGRPIVMGPADSSDRVSVCRTVGPTYKIGAERTQGRFRPDSNIFARRRPRVTGSAPDRPTVGAMVEPT